MHIRRCTENNIPKSSSLICEFGCGRKSTHVFKSGKACCRKTRTACLRFQNSDNESIKCRLHKNYILCNRGQTNKSKGYGHLHSYETKQKLSAIAKKNKNGGYKKGAGKGKKGWYKGIWCSSSWELAFVIYNLDHSINISRCTEIRSYTFNGKVLKYYPDFVINGSIYEIKGWKNSSWLEKQKSNPDIIVLYELEMKPYLEYTINKYGKNYVSLYTESELTE